MVVLDPKTGDLENIGISYVIKTNNIQLGVSENGV
jgi:hypothetical protein